MQQHSWRHQHHWPPPWRLHQLCQLHHQALLTDRLWPRWLLTLIAYHHRSDRQRRHQLQHRLSKVPSCSKLAGEHPPLRLHLDMSKLRPRRHSCLQSIRRGQSRMKARVGRQGLPLPQSRHRRPLLRPWVLASARLPLLKLSSIRPLLVQPQWPKPSLNRR